MKLKDHLIKELKELQRVIKSAPGNLRAVMRAGQIVTALREQFRVPDDEMKRILSNGGEKKTISSLAIRNRLEFKALEAPKESPRVDRIEAYSEVQS